jgi:hypothetical protein
MKHLLRILTLVILVGATLYFTACDSGSDPQKSEKQVQIDLLVGTWNSSSVVHNSVNVNADFSAFKLTIAQAGTAETMTFTTTGRPAALPSPWPASGTISFGNPVTTALVFGDGATATYAVSGSGLTITFTGYSGAGYTGRTASAAGDWVFTFTK